MAFDAFLNIDGAAGESTDDKHKGWIEVLYFSHGESQPASATASSAGGGSTERVTHHPFVIRKEIDKASPLLMQACCSGKHFATVTLHLNRAGGDKVQYMEVKMEQVVISSVTVAEGRFADGGKTAADDWKAKVAVASSSTGGGGGGTGKIGAGSNVSELPVETVTFDYGKIKWTYTQQKRADGSGGGNTTGGWDLTANKVYS
jgi:type VI secretion system secreted protein Hcp